MCSKCKTYLTLDYSSWFAYCLLRALYLLAFHIPTTRACSFSLLNPFSATAMLAMYAARFPYHISFPLQFSTYPYGLILLPAIYFSPAVSPSAQFSSYVVLTDSFPVIRYFTASSGWPPISPFGARARRTLHCYGVIFLTAVLAELFQALPVIPLQCALPGTVL